MNEADAAHDVTLDAKFDNIVRLREVALTCTRCHLYETRTHVVFGEGPDPTNTKIDIMLFGEAPGEDEDAQGRPFVGRSGRFLDNMLKQAGIPRETIWVTNTVKSRPVQIENGIFKNRAPTTKEQKACEIWWRNELSLIQPKIILCLGATSAKMVGGDKNFQITKDRGRWLPGPYDTELFVTFHPAYILRLREPQLSEVKQTVLDDFKAVSTRLEALKNGTAAPQSWQKTKTGEGEQLTLF